MRDLHEPEVQVRRGEDNRMAGGDEQAEDGRLELGEVQPGRGGGVGIGCSSAAEMQHSKSKAVAAANLPDQINTI